MTYPIISILVEVILMMDTIEIIRLNVNTIVKTLPILVHPLYNEIVNEFISCAYISPPNIEYATLENVIDDLIAKKLPLITHFE